MNKLTAFATLLFLSNCVFSQWSPQGNKIKTPWTDKVQPENVLNEYPRPVMEREQWQSLNGLWDYTILPIGQPTPDNFRGKILVPFAIESSLSGVMKPVGENNELWYQRTFEVPKNWKDQQILLHFGAVDWKTDVWINDIKIGTHTGGYSPFSFDITPFLNKAGKQKIVVRVWDGTNSGFQPRGKQVNNPEGIWYTAVTGIWQTVWIEPVPKQYISALKTTPNIDKNNVNILALINEPAANSLVQVAVFDGQKQILISKAVAGQPVEIILSNPKLWSPDSPFLYQVEVSLIKNGATIDQVKSYFAMRKISTQRDENGIVRLQLNNKDQFQFGPLDQGWWPDGLYTAPTEEALVYDIQKTKDMGFNMIRKHVKVEPARWYYHCDKLGMLVWQDMPSGDGFQNWQNFQMFIGSELVRTKESECNYRKEWKEIIDNLYNYPCIVTWVPFNEAWGQFKTIEITEWTKQYDPSRLVNSASGGNHFATGDMLDMHHYPNPAIKLFDGSRANVLGEYGGIGLALPDHLWVPERNWGYVQFKNSEEVTNEYLKYAEQLKTLIKSCYSAAVYTQTTDVEIEVNGLMTYDRKVIKLDEAKLKKTNIEICNSLNQK